MKFLKKDILNDSRLLKVVKTGISSLLIKVFSVVISFISIPLTLDYLGKEGYGFWLTVTSVFALITYADFGLGNGLTNSIAKAHANESDQEAKIYISNTFFVLLVISIILLLGFFLMFYCFDCLGILKNRVMLADVNTKKAVFVIAFLFIINLPLGIIQRVFEGYQKGYIYQYFLLVGNLIGFIFLYVFIQFNLGLPYLSFALLSSTFIANLFSSFYLFLYLNPHIKPNMKLVKKSIFKSSFHIGLVFFVLQIFGFLNLSSDNFIIAYFTGISNVPSFDIVKKLFTVSFLVVYFITPLWPAFSDALLKQDYEWAKKIFYKSLFFSLIFTSVLSGILLIFSPFILHYWVGDFIRPTWNLLFSFYFFTIVANFGGIMGALMNTKDLLTKQVKYVGFATLVTVILKIVFINYLGSDFLIWANVIGFGVFFIYPSFNEANIVLLNNNSKKLHDS